MTEDQNLVRWRKLMDAASQDGLVGFFQKFRPHGNGLTAAFEGVVGADEFLPRLLRIYQATAEGWDETDAYFVVRRPTPLSQEKAKQFATLYLQKMGEVAAEVGNADLVQLLKPLPRIEIVVGKAPWPPGQDDPETLIYEARTDFILSLTPQDSQVLLLDDALYHIACDYFLRDYVLWPLYKHSTAIADPFEPYFDLWEHGAAIRFQGDDVVKVYVPRLD
jgi:hypothetical protein